MLAGSQGFIRNFLRDPRRIGAVAPATRFLADSVAAAAHDAYREHAPALARPGEKPLQVLELGAGTGALTQRIAPLRPVLVERDEAWAALLRQRFPHLEVRQECAIETLQGLAVPVGIVSSIPLLNNPESGPLKALLGAKYASGVLKFCVLYTYGWDDPLAGSGFRASQRVRFVARSFPPAHVWVYQ